MMYMNLDAIPANKAMFTVYVTLDEEVTPDVGIEEIDVVTARSNDWGTVCSSPEVQDELKKLFGEEWIDTKIVGVVNQSDGYVVWQDPASKE